MRIGRRYSRSAGTMSSAGPAYAATDWFGVDRAVSPGAGSALVAGGGEAGVVVAATAGSGMPSTGTGTGGEPVGSGFPSASTTPASQGAAVAGAVSSPASPLGRPPGVANPEAAASMTATAGGRSAEARAALTPGRASPARARRAPQRRNCRPKGTGRSPGRPISPGVATPSHEAAAPGATQRSGRTLKYKSVIPKNMCVISAGSRRDLSAVWWPKCAAVGSWEPPMAIVGNAPGKG